MATFATGGFRTPARALMAALASLWLAFSAGPASGQKLRFRQLTPDDGLSSSWVRSIVQDRQGFLWFGTSKGLDRYDGYGFQSYTHENDDSTSLASASVRALYQDRAGVLWVGTDAGLSRYDPARDGFANYRVGTGGMVLGLEEDARGRLWVATGGGLYLFDREAGRARIVRAAGTRLVNAVHADAAGRVWIGTQTDGLYLYDPTSGSIVAYRNAPANARSLPDNDVRAIVEDAGGALWIGTWNGGVARLDPRTRAFRRYRHDPADPVSLASDRVVALRLDGRRGLWIAGENAGLDHLDPATGAVTHTRPDAGDALALNSASIWAIHQDSSGTLWLGTHTGGVNVTRRNSDAVRHFRSIPGDATSLGFNAVRAFVEDGRGTLWVGTDGGGLNGLDPRTGQFTHYTTRNSNLNSDAVLGLAEDRDGAIWLSAWGGGISRFDGKGGFTSYTRRNTNLGDDNVFSLLIDRSGRIWAGTRTAGLYLLDRGRGLFVQYVTGQQTSPTGANSDGGGAIRILRETQDGRYLLLGTDQSGLGLLDLATRKLTFYRNLRGETRSLADNSVRSLLESGGKLWIGTGNGLDRLDLTTRHLDHFTRQDGLPSNFIAGLALDRAGQLWASTDRGIVRFTTAGSRLQVSATYALADGLQGAEFNPYAYYAASDGSILFGGNNGFNLIHPDRIVTDLRKPAVVLTGFQLFNQPVRAGTPGSPLKTVISRAKRVVLNHKQSVVTFEFAALDYSAPEKNRYAYKLEGFDADWNDVGHKRTASYTNLPAGTFTFRVKGSNADGVWNDAGVALELVVKPPFWRTWWFRGLLLLAIVGSAWEVLQRERRRRLGLEVMNRQLADAADRDRRSQQYLERNVVEILSGMERFSAGDLSATLPVTTDDAIGKLRGGFNTAVGHIRTMVVQVQDLVHATVAASEEITASTEELSQSAARQIQQTTEVAGTAEQMNRAAEENARHIAAAAELAQQSGEDAKEGTRVVRETLEGMDGIVTIVGAAAHAVETLGDSSEKIGEITAVIGEIAGEINLVALNAAIEAARAGEHGRTFTVVADEVRKLADRAELAATEIAQVIDQNQQAIARAVTTMGQVSGQVDTGKLLVDRAGAALDSVISNSQRVLGSIEQVTHSSEEQARATGQITGSVESIAGASRSAAEGNQTIAHALEDLNRLIEDVQEHVARFHLEAQPAQRDDRALAHAGGAGGAGGAA